jgi:hypothetical protein
MTRYVDDSPKKSLRLVPGSEHARSQVKRPWVKPALETFGTIADLTGGPQGGGKFDNAHPPGQNKSSF